ncbi:MAG: DUF3343 domain-containing protein [Mogibacterium sp.]|nr:DUF3343 domain-containing protein [Mogibacterium sp.]
MTYIATFYSHFGAIRYQKICKEKGYSAKAMPVPRNLSSSCGTCVKYEAPEMLLDKEHDEIEQIVLCTDDGYECLWKASDS